MYLLGNYFNIIIFYYLRWNLSYLAWDRLIFLQYAILQLNINLSCSFIHEEKTDGNKLKNIMLNDNEWELLDELCNILAPFEKATRDFSESTYVTLSHLVLIITNLTNSLESFNEDFNNETVISDLEETLTNQQIDYNNITEVLENVKKNIYMGLKYYWAIPDKFGIIATLLDPRYKNLDFISDDNIKKRIYSTLQAQYDQLKWELNQQSIPSSPTTITSTDAESSIVESLIAESSTSRSLTPSRSLHEHKARHEQKTKKVLQITEKATLPTTEDEITIYFLMPVARENKKPLDWWRAKQKIFPILSIIAQKYLVIPATSVASERLFSHAGNHITAKRNSLDPSLLGRMLFLKRNMQTMNHINVFPLDLNVEISDFTEDFFEYDLEES